MRKTNNIISVAAIVSISLTSATNAQNLLTNSGFEAWTGGVVPSGNAAGHHQLAVDFTGWDRTNSNGYFGSPDAFFDSSSYYNASSGSTFAGLAVRNNVGNHESLAQTFTVNAGQSYVVSFDMAPGGRTDGNGGWTSLANSSSVGFDASITGAASFSNFFAVDPGDVNTATGGNPSEWTTQSFSFTASQTGSATLMFETFTPNKDSDPYRHILLDEASVQAVPEPSAALLGLIASAFAMARRRR